MARRAVACVASVTAASIAACASPGAPPGGPVDRNPPVIVKVTPDSGTTNSRTKAVTISFSEVVSERPRGGEDLSGVVVLSPSDGPARVQWQRDKITVRPRKEFRPNTAYSVTVMAGLSDLSGNATRRDRVIVFSTGPVIPKGIVRGAVFDWTTNKPAGGALIDAQVGKDSTFKWIARADSVGRFTLPFLPTGDFTLRALLDANRNGKLDPRELWDSVAVTVADSLRVDFYAFVHDTLGARVVGVDVKDSVTLRLTFDRPLSPDVALQPSQVEILRPDSSSIAVRSLQRAAIFDSLARAREAAAKDSALRADTTKAGRALLARTDSMKVIQQRDSIERARLEARRAVRDTIPKVVPPVPTRTALASDLIAVLAEPLAHATYRIVTRDVISVSRVKRTSERTFTPSKPAEKKPPEAAKPGTAKADSANAPSAVPAAQAKPPTRPPGSKPPAA